MHVRTGVVSTCPDSTGGGSENGERAGVERRRGEGKVVGMTEGRGGRKAWGIRMAGELRHCSCGGGIDATAAYLRTFYSLPIRLSANAI